VKEMLRETSERVIHDEKKTKLALDEVKKPAANKIKVEEPADAEINEEPKYEETEVKQNRIVGDDPIERKTVAEAKIPKKVMETVEKDDLSFFDQLED
jgi:hypothetical protein